MTRRTKVWLVAVLVLLLYLAAALAISMLVKLDRGQLIQLWLVLGLLGLVSAGIVIWFFGGRVSVGGPKMKLPPLEQETEALLAAARGQLARAGFPKRGALRKLPVALVIGPESSAKTTSIVRSAIGAELLAGDLFRGETVAPTRAANLWLAKKMVFVEAGSAVIVNPGAWKRLIHALRPGSLRVAIGGGKQAPRLAIVCFSCEELQRQGAGESVPAAARVLRERLGDAAKQFGVSLPTYVLFTRADAIPNFEAFFHNFSADEAREPLGVAVGPDQGGAGTYADRATTRLQQGFEALFHALALRRPDVLGREPAPDWRPAAYELPREVRKLKPVAIDFLREIGRPSERASPVLRGFYFVGVQPVYVVDEAQPQAVAAVRPEAAVRSATAVFGAAQLAATPAAPAGARTRKVPRWDFLDRLVTDVVLADREGVRLTEGGTRVGIWRRTLLGLAAVLFLVLGMAFAISYVGNHRLERRALDAARGLAALPAADVDLPSLDALRRLDALRAQVDTLRGYARGRPPLHLRWGLYAGGALYPDLRRAYFAGFDKLIFGATRSAVLGTLRSLPDTPRPTDDYGDTYALLKAYLITTTHPEKSDTTFLPTELMKVWLGARTLDAARTPLARRQFETYAAELRLANPYTVTADADITAHVRTFLRQFAGSERIYQFMLGEASRANPPVQFNRTFPGSAKTVVDGYEVAGAFTKGGWDFMQTAFKSVDRFLQGESWVAGDDNAPIDRAKLTAKLRDRYAADYIKTWRAYLQAASVVRYSSVKDASEQLTALSGNQSPLLALFALASRNTAVNDSAVSKVFQPVQSVSPPNITDKLMAPPNAPYIGALVTLQSSLDQVTNAKGSERDAAAGQASTNAAAAKAAARQIAAGFTIDPQGQLQTTVERLMEDPITYVEPMLRNFGASEINPRARTFCAAVRPLLAKFPFAPDATAQLTVAEIGSFLRPNTGMLWTFYNDVLQAMLQKQGTQYAPAGSGTTKLTPEFVAFFNRAAAVSDALFKDDSPDAHFTVTVTPQPSDATDEVVLSYDGDPVRSVRGGNKETAKLSWPGLGREAKLSAKLGSTELTLVGPFTGPMALIQLFYSADSWQQNGEVYRVEWSPRTAGQKMTLPNGQPLKIAVDVNAAGATAFLRRGTFSASDCSGDIAK